GAATRHAGAGRTTRGGPARPAAGCAAGGRARAGPPPPAGAPPPVPGGPRAQLLVPGPLVDGERVGAFDGRWTVQRGLLATVVTVPHL
ncbi:hypothetical protein ACFVXP_15040, partial [Streptomyces sp. NPDC058255]